MNKIGILYKTFGNKALFPSHVIRRTKWPLTRKLAQNISNKNERCSAPKIK